LPLLLLYLCYFWMYGVVLHMVSWVDNATFSWDWSTVGIHWDRQIPTPPWAPKWIGFFTWGDIRGFVWICLIWSGEWIFIAI
jgi:hypothetical protein